MSHVMYCIGVGVANQLVDHPEMMFANQINASSAIKCKVSSPAGSHHMPLEFPVQGVVNSKAENALVTCPRSKDLNVDAVNTVALTWTIHALEGIGVIWKKPNAAPVLRTVKEHNALRQMPLSPDLEPSIFDYHPN
ncbi:predicted protein [Coccidioides posadasii str. Silveira]|uniref:Predicted protein n=1 Tax=Coccidioides posadasii (strain RMSCC 757 / Silveira) TaxID=443226 RepID=E9CS55_COCPS|nr:predicted protein [Coccidioides posadasii str. Silveira]